MTDCCGNYSMCGPNCVTPALGCFPGDPGWVDEDAQDEGPPGTIWGYIPFHDEHVPVRYRLTGEAFCRLDGEGWPCAVARGVR